MVEDDLLGQSECGVNLSGFQEIGEQGHCEDGGEVLLHDAEEELDESGDSLFLGGPVEVQEGAVEQVDGVWGLVIKLQSVLGSAR